MSKPAIRALRPVGPGAFFFLPLLGLLLFASGSVRAQPPLNPDAKACLGCHGEPGMTKEMAQGQTLKLDIKAKPYAQSVHNDIGCAGCHAGVDLARHPAPDSRAQKLTLREYSVAQIEVCRQCHEDKFKLYEGSIHAKLARGGNEAAPLCSDCHPPHAVLAKKAAQPMEEVTCRNCHYEIFEAYAKSVHGVSFARNGGGAPICADCHRVHDVAPAAAGEPIKETCLTCHADTASLHKAWLPNTERHFKAVSCGACHAPGVSRRVDLKLFDAGAGANIGGKEGVPWFESRTREAGANGGLDALAIQGMLKEFNSNGNGSNTVLRGRLEVANGADGHLLAHKEKALKDCRECHQAGADPFQKVTLSMVDADGRPLRVNAQNEVLRSAASVDSMRGFYAIGATRIKLLDWIFLAVLAIGIIVPIGHLTLRWLFRKYLNRAIAEFQARGSQNDD